jgi:PKD domain
MILRRNTFRARHVHAFRSLLRAAVFAHVAVAIGCRNDSVEPATRAHSPAPHAQLSGSALASMYALDFVSTTASGLAMNDAGDVVGTSYLDNGCGPFCLPPQQTVAWRGGTRIVLPPVPGFSGLYPSGINSQGVIVGIGGVPGTTTHAATWTPAGASYTVRDLGALPGMSVTTATGIDDQGRVVGWSSTGGAFPTAAAPFMWSLATGMVNLAAQGYPNNFPTGISRGGTVATPSGWYRLGNPTVVTPYPTPPSGFYGPGSAGVVINDNGDQALFLGTSSSQNLRYLFRLPSGGAYQMLSSSPTGHLSRAGLGSINSSLDVTGTVTSTGIVAAGPGGVAQGLVSLISPAYNATSVSLGGPMNASGQILAHVYLGRSPRLMKMTPVVPCGANCLIATVALTSQFVQDPNFPGSCFQGGKMYNSSQATVTVTSETGTPLSGVFVRGHFMDDYWTDSIKTGTTNAVGVVSFAHKGLCGVGAIEFLVDQLVLGSRSTDRTRGTLAAWVIPSVAPPTNQPPVAAFTYSCSNLVCAFDGTSSTDDVGITAWKWTGPNGGTWANTPTFTRTFNAPTTVNVTLKVTDGGGLSNSITKQVVVTGGGSNQPPVASWVYSCTPARVCTFDGTASTDPDGTIVSYSWTGPGGAVLATTPTFTRTFNKATTASVTLKVTDNGGLANALTKVIVVP